MALHLKRQKSNTWRITSSSPFPHKANVATRPFLLFVNSASCVPSHCCYETHNKKLLAKHFYMGPLVNTGNLQIECRAVQLHSVIIGPCAGEVTRRILLCEDDFVFKKKLCWNVPITKALKATSVHIVHWMGWGAMTMKWPVFARGVVPISRERRLSGRGLSREHGECS